MGYTFAVVVISILVMIGLPTTGMGDPLAFEFIDVPNAGPTVATGINNRGQIVGLFVASGTHGFLLSKGQFATIDVIPGASDTEAYGLNDKGDIVGIFTSDGGTFHGFLLTQGSFIRLDVPGASSTNALSINNAGRIVGISRGTGEHGFSFSHGRFVAIDVPGALSTQATG